MSKFTKFLRENLTFLVILGLAIVFRLWVFDYPLTQEETNRDFLIARYIQEYKEPIVYGPRNGTIPGLGNSPVYYYFLAILFSIFDNVMFVSIFNFVLQISTIILIYLIVKDLLGKKTAVFSGLFLASARILILASRWVWQPHVMYFFLVLSFYLLLLSFQKRSTAALLAAIASFVFSLALHMSVLGILPAFLVLVLITLKKQRVSLFAKFFVLLFFLFITTLFFIPQITKMFSDYHGLSSLSPNAFVQTPMEFLANFENRLGLLAVSFNPIFIYSLLPLSFLYLKTTGKSRVSKIVYLFLIFSLSSFLTIFSLFKGKLMDQHFYPLYPLVAVLGAGAISKTFSSRLPWSLVKYALAGLLAISLITGVKEMRPNYPFERLKAAKQISETLTSEIQKIKIQEERSDLNFFQFRVYAPPGQDWFEGNENIIDSIYWVLLSDQFESPFIKLARDNTILQTKYELLNSDEYIFIVCINYQDELEERQRCLEKFKTDHKTHIVLGKLQEKAFGQSFYVAKR